MRILVLNSGSSSIKYQLLDPEHPQPQAKGSLERIGEEGTTLRHDAGGPQAVHARNHEEGFALLAEVLSGAGMPEGIGHRVVHGGERFHEPTLVDGTVVEEIRRRIPLAPLHNPGNLAGIEAALRRFPGVPQVAVFDTAFHQTMPPRAYRYAVPKDLYERQGLRRYGFHGTSHSYVSREAAKHLRRNPEELALIVLHLGNGASATAIDGGRSVDTSMGLTPMEGLVMGTRSGDLDPGAILFLAREGRSIADIDAILNRESGLKGLAGVNDMREVERRAEAGDGEARLALEVCAYRIRKYVGAYAAALGRLDGVIFTAGIGEKSPEIRERVCGGLGILGIVIDPARNRAPGGGVREIQREGSRVKVLVVPTNEELEIALQTRACILGTNRNPP